MEKLNTIQKRNKLNEVSKRDQNTYHIDLRKADGHIYGFSVIGFPSGPRYAASGSLGITETDLLEIVRDRLTCFQNGDFACRENEMALQHVDEALLWLNKRVEDRAERGVLGTEEK